MVQQRSYTGICLEGLRKIVTHLQDMRCSCRQSNRAPPDRKSTALPLHRTARSMGCLAKYDHELYEASSVVPSLSAARSYEPPSRLETLHPPFLLTV